MTSLIDLGFIAGVQAVTTAVVVIFNDRYIKKKIEPLFDKFEEKVKALKENGKV